MAKTHSSSQSNTWLFSLVGVFILLLLLIVVNFIVKRAMAVQIDLTEDKLHTLSDGTKDILASLDTPVKLSYFVSKDRDNMLPELATFAEKVGALLEEYEGKAKDGLLELERIDPEPDSEDEDRAKLNNLQSIPGRLGDPVYLGLTATCLDRKASIPLMLPNRDQLIEYEISRAILEVTREAAPKIGIISALPVAGGMPAMPFGQQQRPQQPWYFYSALKRDYDPGRTATDSNVVTLELDVEQIPEDIDVVLLVHPGGVTENTQFALDQFLLRGGHIIAYLDAFSVIAQQSQPQRPPFGGAQQPPGIPTSSNLEKLLPAWGVSFEANQVMADRTFESPQRRGEVNPTVLTISAEGINSDDALTSSMRELVMYMAGAFFVEDKEGIKVETLVHSSEKSQLVASTTSQFSPNQIVDQFEASGKEYPLAIRLTGTFATAFPEGKPSDGEEDEESTELDESEEGDESEEEEKEEWLEKSSEEGSVLLVADSDMLYDGLAVSRSLFGISYNNHNMPMLQGAVEQAVGGTNLIGIRSRGSTSRPFNKFKELRAEASEELTKEIAKVEEKEQELANEIRGLMQEQGNSQMVVLSAEAQQKIEELREQETEARQRRRELRRELRKDINKIENNIKLANILVVPTLVLLVGIIHIIVRRRQISAK